MLSALVQRLWVAIPDSILMECSTLREKTEKVGLIGRAVAIFGVERVFIYRDRRDGKDEDAHLVSLLLSYMETPPYLRRALFPIKPELKFAGLLPPLKMVHHKEYIPLSELKEGELREGIVKRAGSKLVADVGLSDPLELLAEARPGTRVTVRVVRRGARMMGELANKNQLPRGWGFTVHKVGGLLTLLRRYAPSLFVATAREGTPVHLVWQEVIDNLKRASSVLVAFGSPARGLYEIVGDEGARLEGIAHYILNTIPEQHVATVRSEEALLCTLAILNVAVKL